MSGELIPIGDIVGGDLQKYDDSTFNALAAASKYLPRLMLGGSSSKPVKANKITMGTYYLVKGTDTLVQLSEEVDCIAVAWRPFAMHTGGDDIITSSDPDSDSFKSIQADSDVKDSGAMWGFEFLLWLRETEEFVTYFASSKTARREAPNLKALIGKAATLKVQFIDPPRSKHSWHGPLIVECSTPFANLPSTEDAKEAVEKFQKNVESETEVVKEEGGRER